VIVKEIEATTIERRIINMKTSYFSKSANNPRAVSIAGKAPSWFKGREYKQLAPNYWFFKKYKEDGDQDFYTKSFQKEILDNLDPHEVAKELGEEAILLCWERTGKFCHRHIVSKWFKENEIEIEELE